MANSGLFRIMVGCMRCRGDWSPHAARAIKDVLVLTLLCCSSHVLLVSAQTEYATGLPRQVSGAGNETVPVAAVNTSDAELAPMTACPPAGSCADDCGGALAGAIVASLLIGLVLGAVAMFFTQRYLKKRKMDIPPKDYCEVYSSALDVNMNNGERTSGTVDAAATSEEPPVKGHKKLERLSKQGLKPALAPKPVLGLKAKPSERSSVETPLIYTGPRSDDVDTASSPAPAVEVRQRAPAPAPSHQPEGSSDDGDSFGDDCEGDNYTNIGLDAASSQPYDSLDVIPEEVEYANTQEYEEVGLVSRG